MRLHCNKCGKPITTEIPEGTIIRAWCECPECIEDNESVNKTTWVERFDKKYLRLCDYIGDKDYKDVHEEVKSFIQAELQQQRREWIEMIEGMKHPISEIHRGIANTARRRGVLMDAPGIRKCMSERTIRLNERNKCLDDIIKKVGKDE